MQSHYCISIVYFLLSLSKSFHVFSVDLCSVFMLGKRFSFNESSSFIPVTKTEHLNGDMYIYIFIMYMYIPYYIFLFNEYSAYPTSEVFEVRLTKNLCHKITVSWQFVVCLKTLYFYIKREATLLQWLEKTHPSRWVCLFGVMSQPVPHCSTFTSEHEATYHVSTALTHYTYSVMLANVCAIITAVNT